MHKKPQPAPAKGHGRGFSFFCGNSVYLNPCTQVGGGGFGGPWFTQVLVVQLVTQKLLHWVHSRLGSADAAENTDNTSHVAVATTATPPPPVR